MYITVQYIAYYPKTIHYLQQLQADSRNVRINNLLSFVIDLYTEICCFYLLKYQRIRSWSF